MVIYCGTVSYQKKFKEQHPDLVHAVLSDPSKLATTMNQVLKLIQKEQLQGQVSGQSHCNIGILFNYEMDIDLINVL